MWAALRRFRELSPEARGLFVSAAILLPMVRLSLRLRGFRATQSSLRQLFARSASSTYNVRVIDAVVVARAVRSAAYRSFGNPNCLERSLTLWGLLQREGLAAEIRIGAKKQGEAFEAHAWVECQGQVLNEPQEVHKHYNAFDEGFAALEAKK